MKKTVLFILGISLILFVYSCANNNSDDNSGNQDSTENVVVEDKPIKEDFATFYEKFVSDENFQLERVKFPVEGSNIIGYDEEEEWTKENWIKLNNIDEVDQKELTVETDETDTKVEHKIYLPNSGFGVTYAFELIDGKWFLTERTDTGL